MGPKGEKQVPFTCSKSPTDLPHCAGRGQIQQSPVGDTRRILGCLPTVAARSSDRTCRGFAGLHKYVLVVSIFFWGFMVYKLFCIEKNSQSIFDRKFYTRRLWTTAW